jgi:hypothetical protein
LVCRNSPYKDAKFSFCPNHDNINISSEDMLKYNEEYQFTLTHTDLVNNILKRIVR